MGNAYEYPGGVPDPEKEDESVDAEIAFKNTGRPSSGDDTMIGSLSEDRPLTPEERRKRERKEDEEDRIALEEHLGFQGSPEEAEALRESRRRWKQEEDVKNAIALIDPMKNTGKREE